MHGYGFCDSLSRWCTTLKTFSIEKYLKEKYPGEQICHLIGLAADEQKRIKQDKLQAGLVRYPLIEWGKTERDCLEYCYSKGYRWGLYEHKSRVSCWCCPLQSLRDLEVLYRYHPALWQKLKEMQARSIRPFRKDYSIYGLEQLFIRFRKV